MATETKRQNQQVPARVRQAIVKVVDYLYEDEIKDYLSNRPDTNGHIFLAVATVLNWLDGVNLSPDEYCERRGHSLVTAEN